MRVSAETLNRGWVGMGEWARVVGEWVVIGCVVLPSPPPPTTNISLLSDVRQRTNLAWRANTMVQTYADNTHQHLFHC